MSANKKDLTKRQLRMVGIGATSLLLLGGLYYYYYRNNDNKIESKASSSCCGSNNKTISSCCGSANKNVDESKAEYNKSIINKRYSNTAKKFHLQSEEEQAKLRAVAKVFGYSPSELAEIGDEANLGLGCGNPV